MFDESGGLNKLVEGKTHIKTGGGIIVVTYVSHIHPHA